MLLRAAELGLQGGLHWPVGLPQCVVAGKYPQDVLSSLILQAAGNRDEGTGLISHFGSQAVVQAVVPRTASQQDNMVFLPEDVGVVFLHPRLHGDVDYGFMQFQEECGIDFNGNLDIFKLFKLSKV